MLNLFLVEFKRHWLEFIRYPADVVIATVVMITLFYALFLSTNYMAGSGLDYGNKLDTVIVGYTVWAMILYSLTSVANEIQKEARSGVLQQVFLSSYGPIRVFVLRTLTEVVLNMFITLTILFSILLLTGRRLDFSMVTLVPIGSILLGSFGLAFLLGALALWMKRAQQLMALGQFALLFLMMVQFETWNGAARMVQFFLPMVCGVGLLRDITVRNTNLDWGMVGIAYINGLLYAVAGLVIFGMMIKKIKRQGTLGWY